MASSVVIVGKWSHYCGSQIRTWSYRQLKLSTLYYWQITWRTRYPVSMSICMLHWIIILCSRSLGYFSMHLCYLVVKSCVIALIGVRVKWSSKMFLCLFDHYGQPSQCSMSQMYKGWLFKCFYVWEFYFWSQLCCGRVVWVHIINCSWFELTWGEYYILCEAEIECLNSCWRIYMQFGVIHFDVRDMRKCV